MMRKEIVVHKKNTSEETPLVSIILLDWSVREWFQALEWLPRQDIARGKYEIIWVELYDRVVPEALEIADVVITCGQQGIYRKHDAYNVGLLHARGQVITVCDSDAVFPPDFISSIFDSFALEKPGGVRSLVLMHHEWRTATTYPGPLSSIQDLNKYEWLELWPNAGACMSVLRTDAIHFGGFDEHRSFRGYLCGPYDLGWRLVNAGVPEIWHHESTALWHFAHPDPPGSWNQKFSWKLWREVAHPHVDYHALTAVEAFSTGRLLPLKENPAIYRIRMSQRQIGTEFEEKYAWLTPAGGFSRRDRLVLRTALFLEPLGVRRTGDGTWVLPGVKAKYRKMRSQFVLRLLMGLKKVIGVKKYDNVKRWWHSLRTNKEVF